MGNQKIQNQFQEQNSIPGEELFLEQEEEQEMDLNLVSEEQLSEIEQPEDTIRFIFGYFNEFGAWIPLQNIQTMEQYRDSLPIQFDPYGGWANI